MNNPLALILLLSVLLTACDSQQPATQEPAPAAPVTLRGGKVSLTIDPSYGARITSLQYDGQEVLQTTQDSAGLTWGGTVWTTDGSEATWPPPRFFDTQAYTVHQTRPNTAIFRSELDKDTYLRLEKRFQVTPRGEIGLRYRIINESGMPLTVGAWEVTRLPYAGRIEFPVSDTVWSDVYPLPATFKDDIATVTFDGSHPKASKLFATLRDTAVRYYHNGLVFTKQTMITGRNQVAPGHAPLEIYLDPERKFVEFGLHGGYSVLQPEQRATMRVKWLIQPE